MLPTWDVNLNKLYSSVWSSSFLHTLYKCIPPVSFSSALHSHVFPATVGKACKICKCTSTHCDVPTDSICCNRKQHCGGLLCGFSIESDKREKTMLQVLFEVLCFMCQPGCLLRLTLGINCCLEQSLISCCSKWERLDTSAPWTEHAVVRVALKALACHIRPYHDKVAMLRLIQATIVGEDFMGSFFVIIIGCISAQVFRVSKSMSCWIQGLSWIM